MGVLIYRIAFRTIPRLGISSMALLAIGFFLLLSGGNFLQQINAERSKTYELVATISGEYIDSNQILQIEGVERLSPILRSDGTIAYQGYHLDTEILAVYSNYHTLPFSEGVVYPDNSNMPFLILNKVAAEGFSLDEQKLRIHANDTVILNIDGELFSAVVCGIFDDNIESPMVYVSYDIAKGLWADEQSTEIILALSNVSVISRVVQELREYNLIVEYDYDAKSAWELLVNQAFQSILSGLLLVTCAAVIMQEKRHQEEQQTHEFDVLRVLGLTRKATKRIIFIRICFIECGCLAISTGIALFCGIFSLLALTLCFAVGGLLLLHLVVK